MPDWNAIAQQILAFATRAAPSFARWTSITRLSPNWWSTGTFSTAEPYLDQVNQHIAASAKANGIPMAQVHLAFNGSNGD